MTTSSSTSLDFEELLSRDFRPADVVCLRPRERFVAHGPGAAVTRRRPAPQRQAEAAAEEAAEQRRDFVLRLVAQTPQFLHHLSRAERTKVLEEGASLAMPPPVRHRGGARLEAAFHPLALDDWESRINWQGVPDEAVVVSSSSSDMAATTKEAADVPPVPTQAQLVRKARAFLAKPRNHFLDALVLDETTICWEGTEDAAAWAAQANRVPLVLQMGVAGRSVADKIYLGMASGQRPCPATQEVAYQERMARDSNDSSSSMAAALLSSSADATKAKGSLHHDKQKMEVLIEARQRKRAQMAMEKTNRITQAMGNRLGGGRGRAITSSLMGPGGTERTGRPSRHMVGAFLEAEYLEQLDMVQNHSIVRDLSKVLLRQYHRPKLPLSVVRQDMSWQFQVRYAPTKKEATSAQVTSFISPHSGALAKAKFRTETDLSPSEGKIVVFEYTEERPPIQLIKGMRSKIVNYYRGDKAHCPVSAGGGDRPARKKRTDDAAFATDTAGKLDRLPRLQGPDRPTTVLDWIGKLPKKSKEKRADEDAIDILPEGVTEMLHPKVHGPFIGEIDEGTTISALVSNLFVAPMFRHEREATDFLMILTPPSGAARPGQRESMGVILRDFPSSVFCVGQTEPRQRVNAPSSKGEKNILGPFVSYQIARALSRSQARDGHGLRLDELQDRVLPNSEISASQLRLLLKQVAIYEKDTQIWTSKQVGYDGYAGVEALAKSIPPEGIVAYETASAASRRLSDLGIHVLSSGDKTVPSVGVAMVYLAGQMNASRERWRKVKKRLESSRNTKLLSSVQTALIEKAVDDLESYFKMMRQKHEIATFIYDELQLSPWHLTGEFIDVHKESQGSGMMHLVGLGDPSGVGEGFSFLRKVENKPAKSQGNTALNASLKKITGTDDDLRKLTMKQMADILRSFGKMTEKEITNLKRWDRVHVIREFSTRAASDRMAGGLERFARDEKFKMAEQKKDYRTMINLIWKRQVTALSADLTDKAGADGDGSDTAGGETEAKASAQENIKAEAAEKEDSDSDFEDDDLVAEIEEEMISRPETKNLVAAHAQKDGGDDKDAHELAALLKQREQEKAAQEDFRAAAGGGKQFVATTSMINRKVVRRRITKTHPDGTQTTTFKFICNPEEAGKVMARLEQKPQAPKRNQELKYQYGEDEKPPGNALFEDDDDFEYSTKGRNAGKRRGGARRRSGDRAPSRGGRGTALQFGKRKTPVNKEERMRKRRRDEEDLEVYNSHAKRKTTNNRRERGSIRDRRPHVIFAEKLEAIRAAVEARPHAGPFAKPVNRRLVPSYYEKISNPMDLQTVRDKIGRYEYRTASAMIKDFELMKSNAIKFNTATAPIALEAVAIFEFVSDQIQAVRHELTGLEEQVEDQLSGKNKKRKNNETSASGTVARIGGISVNLGNLKDYDSGSGDDDEVFTGVVES